MCISGSYFRTFLLQPFIIDGNIFTVSLVRNKQNCQFDEEFTLK